MKSFSQLANGARRSRRFSFRLSNTGGKSTGVATSKRAEAPVITHLPNTAEADESQRHSDPKPKVARHELPWVNVVQDFFNPNGVATSPQPTWPQPRWGWRNLPLLTQGSSVRAGLANLATLGWMTQSLWDWPESPDKLWTIIRAEARAPASMKWIPYAD